MHIKGLTIVILRLYALMLFFDCLQGLYRFFANWYYPFKEDDAIGKIVLIDNLLSFVLCIVAGTLLLKFSEKIAEWIVPANADESVTQIGASNLTRMALGFAGATFIVLGLKQLGYCFSLWCFFPFDSMSSVGPAFPLEYKAKIVESFVSIIAGLLLFTGKERITDFLRSFRRSRLISLEPDAEPEHTETPIEDRTPKKPHHVYVVVNPLYGMYLRGLPADEPLWVVDSEKNHQVIKDLKKERTRLNQPEGITTFKHNPKSTPEDWFIAELATIDLHHGGYAHNPPYTILEVIGVAWSNEIKDALKGYGFIKYERTAEGFIARREIST